MDSDQSRTNRIASRIAARNAALSESFQGHDDLDPTTPSGHAYGIGVSTRLTSLYRTNPHLASPQDPSIEDLPANRGTHRKRPMDITPQQVIRVLRDANVDGWVLMGLHGYVGYLPVPRATQDVDVMVPLQECEKTVRAIGETWPELVVIKNPQLIRFCDPGASNSTRGPIPIIDIMLPMSPFQETILRHHVKVDPTTGDRIPTLEAAIVSKYAAMVSPNRSLAKKQYDAGDLRHMINTNHKRIDQPILESLANEVWAGGATELNELINRSLQNKPFEI